MAVTTLQPVQQFLNPLVNPNALEPLNHGKKGYEVFGFAPYWTFNKLDNVDFNTLTTFAYFGIPVESTGDLDQTDTGYATFQSQHATEIFKKAHRYGTRVVLTITQMDNPTILAFLDNPAAQQNAINQTVQLVHDRGIDGVNVDFEYQGDPGYAYRDQFSTFIKDLTIAMHKKVPSSKVSVSVYATAAKDPKLDDIPTLAKNADDIFMMAYDFATAGSDTAMPTDPLYGYKQGKYWYDVSTAVEDFLKIMPAKKLILGVPYYGYNYPVYSPQVNATTLPYWSASPLTQTYEIAENSVTEASNTKVISGWDDVGKVSYKAYYDSYNGTWRMIFLDDSRSLAYKYDFAKDKKLAGVGMWALGFDDGSSDLWAVLQQEFGTKLADAKAQARPIKEITYAGL
jgi:spore germination protein YaaH